MNAPFRLPALGYSPEITVTLCEISSAQSVGDLDRLEGLQAHLRLELLRQTGVSFEMLVRALDEEGL